MGFYGEEEGEIGFIGRRVGTWNLGDLMSDLEQGSRLQWSGSVWANAVGCRLELMIVPSIC